MKKFCALLILSVCLFGCKSNRGEVKINGEITGLGNDTIYLYGNDELSANRMDPIEVKDNKFSVTLPIDTLLQMSLLLNDGQEYPVYLEGGKTITIKGDVRNMSMLDIKGNALNEQLTQFNKTLQEQGTVADSVRLQQVEEFILRDHSSLICIHLLDKYFVQTASPDMARIKRMIDVMDGELQDKPFIQKLSALAEHKSKAEVGQFAPTFTLSDITGKNISRSDYREKYLLISFWASWSDSCKTVNNELKQISKTYKKQLYKVPKESKPKTGNNTSKVYELAILGVSLDMDKDSWKQAVKRDTLNWDQVCNFTGWSSPVLDEYAVYKIPFNVLIDTKGKIIARGIEGEELTKELEKLMKSERESTSR